MTMLPSHVLAANDNLYFEPERLLQSCLQKAFPKQALESLMVKAKNIINNKAPLNGTDNQAYAVIMKDLGTPLTAMQNNTFGKRKMFTRSGG